MSLIVTIKARNLAARKARDSRTSSALTTFIGEAEMIGKNQGREVSDAEVTALLKKFIKNVDENLRYAGDRRDNEECDRLDLERETYTEFLPKQLTEEQLKIAIGKILQEMDELDGSHTTPKMGDVIKALKSEHDGQYDGALASKLIKEALA